MTKIAVLTSVRLQWTDTDRQIAGIVSAVTNGDDNLVTLVTLHVFYVLDE